MALLDGKVNRKRWSKLDVIVAEAVRRADGERCKVCGNPLWICQNESRDLEISTEEHTCYVERARQKREDDARGKDGKGDVSGKSYSAEPFSRSGKPLSAFRDPYWEEKQKHRAQILEGRRPAVEGS